MEENLPAFRDAGKSRCRVYRRRSEASMAAVGCRSPFNPPPLPELALFGLIVQPPRELTASKSKENQGKRLAFPWIPLVESGLFNGLWRIQIKKSAADSARLSGCARTLGLDAYPPPLAPSDPSIVNWLPQKDISYFSAFVNELDEGLAQQISSRPGGDDVRSSFVVVRLATSSPPSPSREEPAPWFPVRRGAFRAKLKAAAVVLNAPLWKRVGRLARRVDGRRVCNDRFRRFAIVNSAVLIARSGSKTVQLAAF